MAIAYKLEPEHPNFLREWIELRGYKVKRLANKAGIPLRTLWEYIGERAVIDPERLERLASVLGCTPEQLVWGYASSTGNTEMDKKRRELLHVLSTAGAALLFPLPEVDWERVGDAIMKPASLDLAVIENLETINKQYWGLYQTSSSKSSVLDGVIGHLKTLLQFLKESHSSQVHQRLCTLASEASQLAGEIFFDRHDHVTAQSCYVFAAAAAKEGKAYDLWSCAFVRHAFLPIYEERYEDALPLLKEARRLALRGDPALPTRFWVAAVEAEAESGVHHLPACQDALERANGVLEIKGTSPAWTRFEGSRLAALQGACYVRLHQPGLAMPALQEALIQFTRPSRRRAMVLTDLAAAAIQSGDVKQACTHMHEVIDITAIGSSSFLREGILRVRQELEPFADLAAVNRVDRRLRELA